MQIFVRTGALGAATQEREWGRPAPRPPRAGGGRGQGGQNSLTRRRRLSRLAHVLFSPPTLTSDRTLTLDLPVDATVETVLAAVEARQGEFFLF